MVKQNNDIVHMGTDRVRIGPWRGDPTMAFLTPIGGGPTAPSTIERCLEVLAERGFTRVLTAALSSAEQPAFFDAGFTVHEELHLLRNVDPSPPRHARHPERLRLRRARPFDTEAVLALDARAFDAFWRLDRDGLQDARRATPSSRYRIADVGGIVGYAITGRAGPVGYLQRLAVDPDHQRAGVGTALILDGLWWARRRGAEAVLVNTQVSNLNALALYERLGFVREEQGLAVLERPLWVEASA